MSHRRILNPTYFEWLRWPYIRGPIYTRPVFREDSRQGNFVVQPIVRMPALEGLGVLPGIGSGVEAACAPVSSNPQAHADCVAFNTRMAADIAANPSKTAEYSALMAQASAACAGMQADYTAWAGCYYGKLAGRTGPGVGPAGKVPWYKDPLYLGAGAVGLAAVGALIVGIKRKREHATAW
jgi:hypothetical protein